MGATLVCGLMLAAGLSAAGVPSGSLPRASGLTGAPEVVAQTDDSLPAREVTMFGAAPLESADEVFGIGEYRRESSVVHYTPGSGWVLGPALLELGRRSAEGFSPGPAGSLPPA